MITTSSDSSIDRGARKKAANISFFVSLFVLGFKVAGFLATNSSAILSDALESIINVVTAIVAVLVIRYAAQPADEEHPYGHGKAEYFSAAFEGGLIFFAAIAIFLESARALATGPSMRALEDGVLLVGIATVFNLALGLYLKRIGLTQKSETLVASSARVLSDVKTTVGVMFGLLMVKVTGWVWLDPVIAMIVAVHLGFEGFGIVRRSMSGLIDETDHESLQKLSQIIRAHRKVGIIDIHLLRAIRSGSFHHIDAHLVVPEFWSVLETHELTHEFEHKVVKDYPYDGEFAFHVDPCRKKFCKICDLPECPVRTEEFVKLHSFEVKELVGSAQY